jgi:hypothetical protein
MSVRIKAVARELPKYSRTTEEIMPLLEDWLAGRDERFIIRRRNGRQTLFHYGT